jgi:hypothetical protein
LAEQKESRVLEGHLMADHVHMPLSIPPKYAVSEVVGFIRGKSAIHLARTYGEHKQNFTGQHFWARGYFVLTVGAMRRRYGNTSITRRQRISAWTNCRRGTSHRRLVTITPGRVSDPAQAALSGSQPKAPTLLGDIYSHAQTRTSFGRLKPPAPSELNGQVWAQKFVSMQIGALLCFPCGFPLLKFNPVHFSEV